MNTDIIHAELQRANRDALTADSVYRTALYDLEQAAAQAMPADTLMRRVAHVTEAEFAVRAANQRVELLTQVRDDQ